MRAALPLPPPVTPLNTLDVAFRRGLFRATMVAAVVLALVSSLALTAMRQAYRADQQRRAAIEGQRTLRRHLYVAQTNLAQQAWEAGNLGRALELLDAQRPRGQQEDLRGFEWRHLWRLCQGDDLFTLSGSTRAVSAVAYAA